MTTTAAVLPETIAALEGIYRFRDRDEVIAYLAANPDLVDLLWDATIQIPRFIESTEPIILDIVVDPEDDGDVGEMFAVVPTVDEPEDIRPRLERLRRDWLIDAARHAVMRFNVGVEYR